MTIILKALEKKPWILLLLRTDLIAWVFEVLREIWASSGLGQLKKQPSIKINQKFKNPIKVSIKKKKVRAVVFLEAYILKMFKIKKVQIGLKKELYL